MMPTGLITLPLRLGVSSARLALGLTERAAGLAWRTVETFVPGLGGAASNGAEPDRPFPSQAAEEREPVSRDEPASRDPRAEFELGDPRVSVREAPPEPEVRQPEPAAPPDEPEVVSGHVDTEPVLVESFAEPGAEDGAGAEVRIDPPWEDYPQLTAADVIQRLTECSAAELAAIELYEAATRRRTTVVSAVEVELKARAASAGEATG